METTVIRALVPLEYKQASLLENLIDRNIGGLESEEIDDEYSLVYRCGGFINKVNTKELAEIRKLCAILINKLSKIEIKNP